MDLLKFPAEDGPDAARSDDGVCVKRPWGALRINDVTLRTGWYSMALAAGAGACLQLRERTGRRLIELSATPDMPAYARLEGGTYTLELFAGVRPGDYHLSGLVLEPMSKGALFRLLAGRGIRALSEGMSLKRLFSLIQRSLISKSALGVRGGAQGASQLGVLTAADFGRPAPRGGDILPGVRFLVRFLDRPMTASELAAHGLERQNRGNYTLDEADPYDLTLYVGHGQRLTDDALARFSALATEHPEACIMIADAWEDGFPTCRVAFDPLLYVDGYPLPHVRRNLPNEPAETWAAQQDRHALISVPLAAGAATRLRPLPSAKAVRVRPQVSIIIPTRDRADLLRTCLAGLFDRTDWPHEVIVVDNGSVQAETLALLDSYTERGLRIVKADIPFNFSMLCNLGAAAAQSNYLLFMNNDVATIGHDWLAPMMDLAALPDVGAVGAKLYYPDGRLQHGGIFVGLTEVCGHLWRGLPRDAQEGVDRLSRNSLRAAVTAALMCIERRKFDAVGGFDEAAFPVTLNDVDLCLRLQANGWFTAFAAQAEATHAEGETRGTDEDPVKRARRQHELDRFIARWGRFVEADPWLPPAVMRSTEMFNLR